MKLGIDCATKQKAHLMRQLANLKTVTDVTDGGAYRQDAFYSQVYVETSLSEAQLEHWLFGRKDLAQHITGAFTPLENAA